MCKMSKYSVINIDSRWMSNLLPPFLVLSKKDGGRKVNLTRVLRQRKKIKGKPPPL